MATPLSHLSLKLNSLLKGILKNPLWMILGIFSYSFPFWFYYTIFKIFNKDLFYIVYGLNPRKGDGLDGVPPIVLKNYASVMAHCLINLFVYACRVLSSLHAGNMLTYSLYLGRITSLTLQTSVHQLYFVVFLKLLQSLTGKV